MKVITLNLWMGRLARSILRYVVREQPDILCMQEVFGGDTAVPIPDRMFDILQRIQQEGNYPYVFFSPRYSVDVAGREVPYGTAILSKFPLGSTRTVQLLGEPIWHVDEHSYVKNITNLQLAVVETPDGPVTVANHHGYHVGSMSIGNLSDMSLGDEQSVAAMKLVVDELHKVTGPLILCGDLNVRPESPAMRHYDGFLRNLTSEYGIKTTLNKLNVDLDIPCDHILVSNDVEAQSFYRSDDVVSDHYPLVLECSIKDQHGGK